MLTSLRIRDFALLDDVELELGPGFSVLTGETGAGKSLLVEAVSLLRGGRASADVVRKGAPSDEAQVEAVFEPPHGPAADALAERLERAGIPASDDGLIVRRVIGRGRSRVYINSTLATAAALEAVAGVLIELAGQHEHQTLGDPGKHLLILDMFGGHDEKLTALGTAFVELDQARTELEAASLDERTRAEREEFLRFQLRELDEIALKPGEETQLGEERERLKSQGKLLSAAHKGHELLYDREGAVVEELSTIVRELSELGRIDPALGRIAQSLDEARVGCEEAASELRRYADRLRADPNRLGEIEERLHLLGKLLRKNRVERAVDLIARQESLTAELAQLVSHDERRAQLEKNFATAREIAKKRADEVSRARTKAANDLGSKTTAALANLGMADAEFRPTLLPLAAREGDESAFVFGGRRLGVTGWDRVEFLLSANKGEDARPLHRIASGGELSRIMLALKRVLSRADQVATYVFDEVDAGIGGAIADVVGREIRSVSTDKQVVCITHLAQIAAYADVHFRVEKSEEAGRVHTVIRKLTADERESEIARMLAGKVTDTARAHAKELLTASRAGGDASRLRAGSAREDAGKQLTGRSAGKLAKAPSAARGIGKSKKSAKEGGSTPRSARS